MGRQRQGGRGQRPSGPGQWESERSLADAEADAGEGGEGASGSASSRCLCGSEELLLQAFVHVVDGQPRRGFVDVESLTCPRCGREFTAIEAEGERILRGDFIGYVDLEEDED